MGRSSSPQHPSACKPCGWWRCGNTALLAFGGMLKSGECYPEMGMGRPPPRLGCPRRGQCPRRPTLFFLKLGGLNSCWILSEIQERPSAASVRRFQRQVLPICRVRGKKDVPFGVGGLRQGEQSEGLKSLSQPQPGFWAKCTGNVKKIIRKVF